MNNNNNKKSYLYKLLSLKKKELRKKYIYHWKVNHYKKLIINLKYNKKNYKNIKKIISWLVKIINFIINYYLLF